MIVLFPLCKFVVELEKTGSKFVVELEKAGSEVQTLQEMVHGHLRIRDNIVPVSYSFKLNSVKL